MNNEEILVRSLEKEVAKKNKRTNLKNIVLATVAIAGMMAVAAVAPNVLGAMGKLGLIPKKRQKEFIQAARDRLIKNGFLQREDGKLKITPRGRIHLIKETSWANTKNHIKKWDGKWRVLIFDIPEKRRVAREQIRMTLLNIGFMRLQDSVWIFPYDCEDLITLLKADMKIGKNVLYMIVEALEYDKPVRSYFGLRPK